MARIVHSLEPAATSPMIDLSQVWETLRRLANGFFTMLPRVVLAVLLAWAFVYIGRLARRLVERASARRRDHETLQLALGRLVMRVPVT